MWLPRTQEEILQTQRRRRSEHLRTALMYGAFMAVLFAVHGRRRDPNFFVPQDQIPSRIPGAILAGVIAGIAVYCWYRSRKPNVVCPQCGKFKTADNFPDCPCGGHFTNADELKWRDDEK